MVQGILNFEPIKDKPYLFIMEKLLGIHFEYFQQN